MGMNYFGAVLALGILWKAASLSLGQVLLPDPWEVLIFFVSWLPTSDFWEHFSTSFVRILSAMALAWVTAFPLGLLLGHCRRIDKYISPLVFLTFPIPKIVLLPIFLTLFGLGNAPKVLIIAITTGYQLLVVTRASALHLDRRYVDAFRSLGGSRLQEIRHVLIPAALPDAITALRVATGTAVAVLFMVESFATSKGLGFLIMDAWGRGDQLEMFSGILAMSAMGIILYEACNVLERILCRWKTICRE